MKNQQELKSLSNNFVLTLKKAGYNFDHSENSLKYIEYAIDGIKKRENTQKAIKAVYVYFAIYISEIFIKELPRFEIRLDFKDDEINEVFVSDGKSTVYFLTWMYSYMENPKKEGIIEKYRQTVKILSGKNFFLASN